MFRASIPLREKNNVSLVILGVLSPAGCSRQDPAAHMFVLILYCDVLYSTTARNIAFRVLKTKWKPQVLRGVVHHGFECSWLQT